MQVKVLPVSEKSRDYSYQVTERFEATGIRVVRDDRDEKIGYKIREAVPMSVDEFVAKVFEGIKTRA